MESLSDNLLLNKAIRKLRDCINDLRFESDETVLVEGKKFSLYGLKLSKKQTNMISKSENFVGIFFLLICYFITHNFFKIKFI